MEKDILDNDFPQQNVQLQQLPNSTGTLVLGILSIVFCCCYGVIGAIMGIIALAISGNSIKMYNANPGLYKGYENLKAGRVCAIIGLSLSSLYVVFLIIYFAIAGTALFSESNFWDIFY